MRFILDSACQFQLDSIEADPVSFFVFSPLLLSPSSLHCSALHKPVAESLEIASGAPASCDEHRSEIGDLVNTDLQSC